MESRQNAHFSFVFVPFVYIRKYGKRRRLTENHYYASNVANIYRCFINFIHFRISPMP